MRITLAMAREALQKAVQTQGEDFIYNIGGMDECKYVPIKQGERRNDDDPRLLTGCVVGVALEILGAPIGDMTINISTAVQDGIVDATWHAGQYFQRAQTAQDKGYTWGYALREAESYLVHADITEDIDGTIDALVNGNE